MAKKKKYEDLPDTGSEGFFSYLQSPEGIGNRLYLGAWVGMFLAIVLGLEVQSLLIIPVFWVVVHYVKWEFFMGRRNL